jgi:hypothetical protein
MNALGVVWMVPPRPTTAYALYTTAFSWGRVAIAFIAIGSQFISAIAPSMVESSA